MLQESEELPIFSADSRSDSVPQPLAATQSPTCFQSCHKGPQTAVLGATGPTHRHSIPRLGPRKTLRDAMLQELSSPTSEPFLLVVPMLPDGGPMLLYDLLKL